MDGPSFLGARWDLGPPNPGCLHPGSTFRDHRRRRRLAGIKCSDPVDYRFDYISAVTERQVEALAGQGPPAPLAAALATAGVWRAVDVAMDGRNLFVFLALAAISTLLATMLAVPVGMQIVATALRGGIRLCQLALYRNQSVE